MKRFNPIPGDLIVVEISEWYALKDGKRLRVCENVDLAAEGDELCVAPRQQIHTFWGPNYGPPNGIKPLQMSTSGGPFKTLKINELQGLEYVGSKFDWFWCWKDRPRAGGGMRRLVEVAVWRLAFLPDKHFCQSRQIGCKTFRDEASQ